MGSTSWTTKLKEGWVISIRWARFFCMMGNPGGENESMKPYDVKKIDDTRHAMQ